MLEASELLSYPKGFLAKHLDLRQTFSCKISPLHLVTPQQKIRASNLSPRGSARDRAQWGQKWKQKLSDPKSWMVAVRGKLDTTNLSIPEILTKKKGFIALIHSHCLFISHWQLRISPLRSSGVFEFQVRRQRWRWQTVDSSHQQIWQEQAMEGGLVMQRRVWKIQRDRKTYPSKIQCFH